MITMKQMAFKRGYQPENIWHCILYFKLISLANMIMPSLSVSNYQGQDCFLLTINLVFPESRMVTIHVQGTQPITLSSVFSELWSSFYLAATKRNHYRDNHKKKCTISLVRILASTHESETHRILSCHIFVKTYRNLKYKGRLKI